MRAAAHQEMWWAVQPLCAVPVHPSVRTRRLRRLGRLWRAVASVLRTAPDQPPLLPKNQRGCRQVFPSRHHRPAAYGESICGRWQVGRPYPVAASSAVELALVGPVRPATVIAATPHATYLEVTDPDRTLLCLASAAAVRVPCAVVLESKALPPQVPVGTTARV